MKYLILNQLGTPATSDPEDVGRYLTEFLSDPNVIDLPKILRHFLVKCIIVPRRKFKSSEKYKKIWTDEGSPLEFHSRALVRQIQRLNLQNDLRVILSMRYGQPSIANVLKQINFSSADSIYYLPLYPQFAQATVGSSIEKFQYEFEKLKLNDTEVQVKLMSPFYNQDWYIYAIAEIIKSKITAQDHLLLSYHGIPLAQEQKAPISYYTQCFQTSELIRNKLNLSQKNISTSFQSRVGFTKWLEPSSVFEVQKLAAAGVKNLKVACPSFVADCLETLEEIEMELKESFLKHGGEKFELIPCLNDDKNFAKGILKSLQ